MTKAAQHQAGFALLWVVTLFLGWHPLVDTIARSLRDDECTYILLILPISAALIFIERRPLRTMITLDLRVGAALFAFAALLASLGLIRPAALSPDVLLSTEMIALVSSWVAAFVLCFGRRAARSVLFPLIFLLGLVPIPRAALDVIVVLLQQGSADSADWLFYACGVPVAQHGVLLSIPGLTVQVAQECSSIRSSSMLLLMTIVLAQLILRSPWRRALLIALVIPLSVAKNGLRIFTIAMLVTRVDRSYFTGKLHREGGFIFLSIALLAVFAVLWILRRQERSFVHRDPSPQPIAAAAGR
jgi:exosortase